MTTGYDFQTVGRIHVAPGASAQLPQLLHTICPKASTVLLVTDQGFLSTGHVHTIMATLESAGCHTHLFADVQADPPESVVLAAAGRARELKSDVVIGLGGGSSMDVAKLIAVLALSDTPLDEMYGIGRLNGQRLPLVQIPTTAGTGSEVTPIAIVTTGVDTKMGIVDPTLYADLVILDATLTVGLPAVITAATGIDAMVHAIEAYTTRLRKNPISDMLARRALELLNQNVLTACTTPTDLEARQAMLLGAMFAGQAFANAPCAAVHALAYPVGGVYHVPHGLSNALVLAQVMRFNLSHCTTQYADLARLLLPPAATAGDDRYAAEALISHMENLIRQSGLPTRLREVDIPESALQRLAELAMLQTRLLANNPRTVALQDALNIYQAAW